MRHPPSPRSPAKRHKHQQQAGVSKSAAPSGERRDAPRPIASQAPLLQTLPLIPEELGIDPVLSALLHTAAFLDLSDDEAVRPDAAAAVLQRVGLYVQRLDDAAVEALADALEKLEAHAVKAEWPAEARDFVRDFLAHCGFVPDEDEDEDEDGAEP